MITTAMNEPLAHTCDEVLVCDFDGTLIKGNIEGSFISFLRREHHFAFKNYACACISYPVNTIKRHFDRGNALRSWSIGITEQDFPHIVEKFLSSSYAPVVNENVLDVVQSYACKKILLTGSDERLVKAFLAEHHLDNIFDNIIGQKGTSFTISQHPYGKDKLKFLPHASNLIGLGNEFADRYFLEKCHTVYIVQPDSKLKEFSQGKDWMEL